VTTIDCAAFFVRQQHDAYNNNVTEEIGVFDSAAQVFWLRSLGARISAGFSCLSPILIADGLLTI
jgi:hypothetical protein